jgi:hypothetical protein
LPIHRSVAGGKRAHVFALKDEIGQWFANLFTLPQSAKTYESDRPSIFRPNHLAGETDLLESARFVPDVELAEAAQLQREPVRLQVVQQSGFERRDDGIYECLGFFLGRQRLYPLNPRCQFVPTP